MPLIARLLGPAYTEPSEPGALARPFQEQDWEDTHQIEPRKS
jgi:hypothetical protein